MKMDNLSHNTRVFEGHTLSLKDRKPIRLLHRDIGMKDIYMLLEQIIDILKKGDEKNQSTNKRQRVE